MPTTSVSFPEAFLDALLDSPLGIAVLDRELRYTHVNLALARMNSSDPRAFIGQTVREVVPHLAAILEPALRRVLQTATAIHDLEVFGEGPDVGRVWSEHLLPLRDADGQVVGVIVTVEETTARQQAQEALLESVIHYRHSVDLNPQIPWTADPDGKILDFSQRWSDLTGLSRESLLGEGWLEVPHPDDVPQMILAWTHALQTGDSYDIESRIRRADGSYI
jgi:PAS domain S-box-containing protein